MLFHLWILTGLTRGSVQSQTALKVVGIVDKLPEESRMRVLDIASRELLLEETLKSQELKKAGCE